jgi:PPP family 3-phenylpropionic acid transporter
MIRALSAFYFFTFGGIGAVMPFLPILLRARGLTATQIGTVMLLAPLSGLVVPPLFGWVADAFRARLALLRVVGLGCGVGALAFLWVGSFGAALWAMALYSFFRAPVVPLADAAAHGALGEQAHRFARIRIFGSLGFSAFALAVGQLEGPTHPALMVGLAVGAHALSALSTARLRSPPMEKQARVLAEAMQFILQPRMLALFVGSALYYVAHGAYDVYFGLHLTALGHSDGFVGLAWMVGVMCEVGLMLVAPRLLEGRTGEIYLFVAGLTATLRFALLSTVTGQAAILATQALHAVTFGLWYLALVRYVQVRAPARARATVQAVAQGATALGSMAGSLAGGRLMEAAGGGAVFQMAAGAAAAAAVFYLGLVIRTRLRGP